MSGPEPIQDTRSVMLAIGVKARAAARELLVATTEAKRSALTTAASSMRKAIPAIIVANALDLKAAHEAGRTSAFIDRLLLDARRIEGIARSLEEISALPDPVGSVITEWTQPNRLKFERVRVPLGVIGIVYESRPNVTADAGALCLMAGNACILRGGSESQHSSKAIHACTSRVFVLPSCRNQSYNSCLRRIARRSGKCLPVSTVTST